MIENAIEAVRLLVVSKEPAVVRSLWSIGEANSWQLETVGSGWEAMEFVQAGATPDVLLLDLPRGDTDSLHILRWVRRLRPNLPIILLCYPDDAGQKNEAIRLGAQDYLIRPLDDEQLENVVRAQLNPRTDAAEMELASEDIEQVSDDAFFVGASPIMRKLRAQAELLAQANVPVLILGENGSGKDTAARLIHKLSVRSGFKFLKVNCAALPGDLLETELFGYERRDSAGAVRSKPGKLELCEKGTILLDEIAEMPTSVQSKLLQVLQKKQFFRPGSGATVDVDVRILAATSADIERVLSEKKLREDLYFRLSAFTVQAPPLRQRKDEIPILLRHFMHHLAKHYGLPARTFSPAVLDACHAYSWPGNLRELEEFVKRYLVMGDKELILAAAKAEHKPGNGKPGNGNLMETEPVREVFGDEENGEPSGSPNSLKSLVQSVRCEAERSAIATALEKTGWNRKAAARLLRVSYRTLLYKIEQYHMSSSETHPSTFYGNGLRGNGKRI
ncbi:MAG: sigma-54 dependent transcriptional regulator [Terriglobales bacterium]